MSLLTIIISALIIVGLPVMLYFKMSKWLNPEFRARYGAFLEGTNLNYKWKYRWVLLGTPVLYLARRVMFVVSVVMWGEYLVIQLFVHFAISFSIFFFYVLIQPFETKFDLKMELFNEVCGILSTYTLMLFTNFVPDPAVRYELGNVFIVILLANFVVHLFFLVRATGMNLKLYCRSKECYKKRCAKKARVKPEGSEAAGKANKGRNQSEQAFVAVNEDLTGEESKVAA